MKSIQEWVDSSKDYNDEVVELEDLKINKFTPKAKEELENYKELKKLTIVACDLRSFENFPVNGGLEELDLTDNKLKGEELARLPVLPFLRVLTLTNNPIGNAQQLKPLTKFSKTLERLSVEGCPLAKKDGYRKEVFQIIGGALKVVDLEDREGNEVAEDDDSEEDLDEDEDEDNSDLIEDDEEGSAAAGKGKAPAARTSGKKQKSEDDEDEEQDEQDDQDLSDEDEVEGASGSEAEDPGPRKQVKRS